jgi:hypothetical protein
VSKQPRTRKKPQSKAAAAADSDTPRRMLRLTLGSLEVARGHDGLLRGKPEPALLVAAYRTNSALPASLVGRMLVRVQVKSNMPCTIELGERELRYDARFALTERILVLVFAVEEDSGEGVAALYAAFETPGQFLLYAGGESIPSPIGLDEWARCECAPPAARPVEVLFGGESFENIAGADEFISASAFSVSSQVRADEAWRLPFVARDQRNDWTLVLRMRVVA